MLILQQINRNIRRTPLVLRHLSTTEVRQSLSDEEKEKIRQKLKAMKEKLLNQESNEENTELTSSIPTKSEQSVISEQDVKTASDARSKFQEKASLIKKQNLGKEIQQEKKLVLQNILKLEVEKVEPVKDSDETKILSEVEKQEAQGIEVQKRKLKNLLDEPVEIQEVENKEVPPKTLEKDEDGKLKALFKKNLEDNEDVEKLEEEDGKKLKGKMKLLDLLSESEKFSVEDKVNITHPVRKIRPVQKAARKAETDSHIKLLKSIKEVADELGGDADKTETELMDAVFKSTASEKSEIKRLEEPGKGKMSSVIGDLNVDHSKDEAVDPAFEIKRTLTMIKNLQRKSSAQGNVSESPDYMSTAIYPLFESQPLNIFDEKYLSDLKETPVLEVYDKIRQKELIKLITHSPENVYEEMIKWTKEGKLWHFPIDNEWKWSWEEDVDFTEHILLEHHLEPWCPAGGPIRHFMELVCVGLSKNPFIPAEEKREHIYWFRDYFEEKRRLLEDVGALRVEKKQLEQGNVEIS